MLENQREVLHAGAAAAHRAFEFGKHAAQRKQERLDSVGFRGQFEARAKTRRRGVGHARIGELPHQPVEGSDDLGAEAFRDAFVGQLQHVAQPKDAEIGQARERFLGPVEKEERKVGDASTQIGDLETAAYLQAARFGAREEASRERRGCDAKSGVKAQVVDAAPNGRGEFRSTMPCPSMLTMGVNCAAQAARRSSVSRSFESSRAMTRRFPASALAAATACPSRIPASRAASFALHTRGRWVVPSEMTSGSVVMPPRSAI